MLPNFEMIRRPSSFMQRKGSLSNWQTFVSRIIVTVEVLPAVNGAFREVDARWSQAAVLEGDITNSVKNARASWSSHGGFVIYVMLKVSVALLHRKAFDAETHQVKVVWSTLRVSRPLDAHAELRVKGVQSIVSRASRALKHKAT